MEFVQPIRSLVKIEEMKSELLKQSKRNCFLFVFGINSGLRISDMLPLKVKDVKGKDFLWAKERKTDKKRKIPMLPGLKIEIDKYIEGMKNEDYLFRSNKTRKPISRVQAYRILNTTAKKIGIEEIGSHSMRKSFGYHFYQRTRDLALVQKVFNHSTPTITMRYIGLEEDEIMKGYAAFGGL